MIHIQDIKKGDRFYESDYGVSIECEAMEDAAPMYGNGWGLMARCRTGEFELFRAEGYEHLSSELTAEPVYCRIDALEVTA